MWNGDDLEAVDAGEIARVARVHRQVVGQRGRGDHRVERARRQLASGTPRRGDLSKSASGASVEHERIEVRLRLLEMSLASGPFRLRAGDERSDGQLGERHDADQRLERQG